jgi:hypothetical protein
MRKWPKAPKLPIDQRDACAVCGFLLVSYGVYQLLPAAGWISAGAMLLAFWLFPYLLTARKEP